MIATLTPEPAEQHEHCNARAAVTVSEPPMDSEMFETQARLAAEMTWVTHHLLNDD